MDAGLSGSRAPGYTASSEQPTRIRMSQTSQTSDVTINSTDPGSGNAGLESLMLMGMGEMSGRKDGSRAGPNPSQPTGSIPSMSMNNFFPSRSTSFNSKSNSVMTGLDNTPSSEVSRPTLQPGMDTLLGASQTSDSSTLSALFWAQQQQPEQTLQSLLGLDFSDPSLPSMNTDAAMQLLTPELRALVMQSQEPQQPSAQVSTGMGNGSAPTRDTNTLDMGAVRSTKTSGSSATIGNAPMPAPVQPQGTAGSDLANLEQLLLRQQLGASAAAAAPQAPELSQHTLELYGQLLAMEQVQQQQRQHLAARLVSLQQMNTGMFEAGGSLGTMGTLSSHAAHAAQSRMGGSLGHMGLQGFGATHAHTHANNHAHAMLQGMGMIQRPSTDPGLGGSGMGMGYGGGAMRTMQMQPGSQASQGQVNQAQQQANQAQQQANQAQQQAQQQRRRGLQLSPAQLAQVQELREFVAERAELRGPGLLTQKEWDAVAAESKRRLLGLRLPLLETLKILMDWLQHGYISQAEFDQVKQDAVMSPAGGSASRGSSDAQRKSGANGSGTGVFLPGQGSGLAPGAEGRPDGSYGMVGVGGLGAVGPLRGPPPPPPPPVVAAAAAAAAGAPSQPPPPKKAPLGQQQGVVGGVGQEYAGATGVGPLSLSFGMAPGAMQQPPPPPPPGSGTDPGTTSRRRSQVMATEGEAERHSGGTSLADLNIAAVGAVGGISFPSAAAGGWVSPRATAGSATSFSAPPPLLPPASQGNDPGSVRSTSGSVRSLSAPSMSAAVQTVLMSNTPLRDVTLRSVVMGGDAASVARAKANPAAASTRADACSSLEAQPRGVVEGEGSNVSVAAAAAAAAAALNLGGGVGDSGNARGSAAAYRQLGIAAGGEELFTDTSDVKGLDGSSPFSVAGATAGVAAANGRVSHSSLRVSDPPVASVPNGLTFASMRLPPALVRGLSDCGYVEPDLLQYRLLREMLPPSVFTPDPATGAASSKGGEECGEEAPGTPSTPASVSGSGPLPRAPLTLRPASSRRASQLLSARTSLNDVALSDSGASSGAQVLCFLGVPSAANANAALCVALLRDVAHTPRLHAPSLATIASMAAMAALGARPMRQPTAAALDPAQGPALADSLPGTGGGSTPASPSPSPSCGTGVGVTQGGHPGQHPTPLAGMVVCSKREDAEDMGDTLRAIAHYMGVPCYTLLNTAYLPNGLGSSTTSSAAPTPTPSRPPSDDPELPPDSTVQPPTPTTAPPPAEAEAGRDGGGGVGKEAGQAQQPHPQAQPVVAVGSPSRLLDLLRKGVFDLSQLNLLVLIDAAYLLSTHLKAPVQELLVGCSHAARKVVLVTTSNSMSRHDLRTLEKLVACAPTPTAPGALATAPVQAAPVGGAAVAPLVHPGAPPAMPAMALPEDGSEDNGAPAPAPPPADATAIVAGMADPWAGVYPATPPSLGRLHAPQQQQSMGVAAIGAALAKRAAAGRPLPQTAAQAQALAGAQAELGGVPLPFFTASQLSRGGSAVGQQPQPPLPGFARVGGMGGPAAPLGTRASDVGGNQGTLSAPFGFPYEL